MKRAILLATGISLLAMTACKNASNDLENQDTAAPSTQDVAAAPTQPKPAAQDTPNLQDAKEFLETTETRLEEFYLRAAATAWAKATNITEETNAAEALVNAEGAKLSTELSNAAKRFNDLNLPVDMRRKIDGLKRGSSFPAPERDGAADELAQIMTRLDSRYGTGKFDFKGETINLGQASDIIAHSRNPASYLGRLAHHFARDER